MNRLLTAALFLTPTLSVLAQEMSPPKEIASLGWMVGTWSGSGNIEFGGHETPITSTITVSLDGQFLKSVSSDKSSGFELRKTSMVGWDATKHQYISYTFTNISPDARIAHGDLETGKLSLISDPWEAEGMKLIGRETVSKISDTKCGLTIEAKQGDKWLTEMNFVLIKK